MLVWLNIEAVWNLPYVCTGFSTKWESSLCVCVLDSQPSENPALYYVYWSLNQVRILLYVMCIGFSTKWESCRMLCVLESQPSENPEALAQCIMVCDVLTGNQACLACSQLFSNLKSFLIVIYLFNVIAVSTCGSYGCLLAPLYLAGNLFQLGCILARFSWNY